MCDMPATKLKYMQQLKATQRGFRTCLTQTASIRDDPDFL